MSCEESLRSPSERQQPGQETTRIHIPFSGSGAYHGDFYHWEPRQHFDKCENNMFTTIFGNKRCALSCDVHWTSACQALGITDLAAIDYESGHDARINFSREGFGGAVTVTNGISSTSHDDERGTKNQDLVQIEVQFGGHPSHALYIGMTHIETSFKVEYIKLFQSIGR